MNRSKARALQICAPAAALVGGLFLTPSLAAAAAPCDDASIVNPVYVTGSSAVKPFLDAVAISLAKAATPSPSCTRAAFRGSCIGVKAVGLGAANMTGTANWYDNTGALQTCDLSAVNSGAGVPADIGASDVFADSCVNFDPNNHENIGDFYGPNQVMQFAVPAASNQTTISAEAAYLTYGLTDGGTTWDDLTVRFRRNEGLRHADDGRVRDLPR